MSLISLKCVYLSLTCIISIITISHIFLNHEPLNILNSTILAKTTRSLTFYPNIAVIVEFRSVDQLIAIVHNVNYHIPSSWPIQIFHGVDNQNFIKSSTLAPLIASKRIILTLMDVVYGKDRTNELLTSEHFWKRVLGEKILFFQIDSAMCSNSPHKINDFLKYDYIGAPWDTSWFAFDRSHLVGNGGFSLRTRSKILSLLGHMKYDFKIPEDVWYAQHLHRVNAVIPSVEIAKTFSVESIYYERPLGVHRYALRCSVRTKLFETCPEARLIMPESCH